MLILMGYITLDPAEVDAFAAAVEAISVSTNAEEGCLFYNIILDDRLSGRFLAAQRWRDRQALTLHLEREETLAFLAAWSGRMKADLKVYDAVQEQPFAG